MKEYEALIILPAKLDDEAVKKAMQAVNDEITTLGGEVVNYDVMGKKVFARPMKKQTVGIYVKMRFNLAADAVKKLLSRLKFNADIFRIQVLKFDPVLAAAREAAKAEKAAKAAAMAAAVETAPEVEEAAVSSPADESEESNG